LVNCCDGDLCSCRRTVGYLRRFYPGHPAQPEGQGIAFFRTCFYIPTVVPAISSAILWGWLLNPDYGLINSVLFKLHLPTSRFLASPIQPAFVDIDESVGIGGGMVIYLAGLQGVSESLYEAAKIDGANEMQLFLVHYPTDDDPYNFL